MGSGASNARRINERYEILEECIGAGATATVHLARMTGALGFRTTVAIKRLHPHLARDAAFRTTLIEEARLSSRVRHSNVVRMVDVEEEDGEIFLVMEYVHGGTLREVIDRAGRPPMAVAVAIARGVLLGLHAAHDARGPSGKPLDLVHRDVNPRNIVVSRDGIAQILDFGLAKALGRSSSTRPGCVRGTLAYMPSEQLHGEPLARETDIYAVAVVLWELLTGERLFAADDETEIIARILDHDIAVPSSKVSDVPPSLDHVVMRGLAHEPENRFRTAQEMALALESAFAPAGPAEVGAWVERVLGERIALRERMLAAMATAAPSEEVPRTPARRSVRVAVSLAVAIVFATSAVGVGMRLASNQASGDGGSVVRQVDVRRDPADAGTEALASSEVAPVPEKTSDEPVQVSAPSKRAAPRFRPRPQAVACVPGTFDDAGHRLYNRDCLR